MGTRGSTFSPTFIAAAIILALILGAAIGSGVAHPSGQRPGGGDPPVVDCDSRLQVIPGRGNRFAPRRASVVAGPVAFLGAERLRHQPRRWFEPRRPGRMLPVKAPIEVEAGHQVVISLPPAEDDALIEVGLNKAPYPVRGEVVELHPCRRNAEVADRRVGPRTPFLGGFRIAGPMCLRVLIEVVGQPREIARRIAFGRRTCRPHG